MEPKILDCLVIEWEHIHKYLTKSQIETLDYITDDIESGLADDGEGEKNYVVTEE